MGKMGNDDCSRENRGKSGKGAAQEGSTCFGQENRQGNDQPTQGCRYRSEDFGEPEIPFPHIPNDVETPDSSYKDEIAGIREEVYLLIEEVSRTKTRLEQLARKGKKRVPKK